MRARPQRWTCSLLGREGVGHGRRSITAGPVCASKGTGSWSWMISQVPSTPRQPRVARTPTCRPGSLNERSVDVIQERAESDVAVRGDVEILHVVADVTGVPVEPGPRLSLDVGLSAKPQRRQHIERDHVRRLTGCERCGIFRVHSGDAADNESGTADAAEGSALAPARALTATPTASPKPHRHRRRYQPRTPKPIHRRTSSHDPDPTGMRRLASRTVGATGNSHHPEVRKFS